MILPDNGAQFGSAKQVFNTNYNNSAPAAVVTVTSPADVQKAMAFAAAHNLKVAPRSGGHSYVGASTANGALVLDLRQLPGDINYDATSGQVTVTPATNLYAIHQALAAAGRGIPTGTCPSVGAAGHALGGGLGAHSRHAGLLCDQLTSASVVLPSGQAVTASSSSNPDLLWALRGGGGGNFGVTTSLTFATFPTGDYDVVNLNFPPQSFAQVLVGWQNWLRTADRSSWALADSTTDAMGTHCRIMATCPAGSGNSVASAITSAVGMQPTGTDNHTFNYLDLVRYLAVGNLNPSPLGYVGGSDVFTTITPAAAQGIAAAVNAFPRGAGRMLAIMHALDGALASRRTRSHGLSLASPVVAGAVVRRNIRRPVGSAQLAQHGTSSGATLFGRRLRELSRGKSVAVALLRVQPIPAQRRAAEVRPGPNHVLQPELLTFSGVQFDDFDQVTSDIVERVGRLRGQRDDHGALDRGDRQGGQ